MSRAPAALLAVAAAVAACGHRAPPTVAITAVPLPATTAADRIVALLPDGAQVVVELDLARLRANPVVGEVVRRALDDVALSTDVALPMKLPASPLAATDTVVLAAYGVGTAQAATLTLLATTSDVPGGRRITDGIIAIGPDAWLDQVTARAAIAGRTPLAPARELVQLRAHAMPAGATGAAVRVTARLSFDARIALARQTGVELAPAQLSLWADVADDLAVVVDADAGREATPKLAAGVRGLLGELADEPVLRALGVLDSLQGARQIRQGTWVRTIVAIGPARLRRVVARASALLGPDAGSGAGAGSGSGAGSGGAS